MKKFFLFFLGLTLVLASCSKDDNQIKNVATPQPEPDPDPVAQVDVTVQNFMWQALNLWYFWQAEVPNLADDRFATNAAYTEFLEANTDPESFYFDTLLFGDDRFSFLNDDYKELVNNLSGVSKSNGLEFGLVRFSGSDDIFGYVQYILPGSDASTKDIQRGDIFLRVDGVQLNINNYIGLLFGDNDTYELSIAHIEGNTIVDDNRTVSLTKVENQVENPILIAETLDVNGTKVAYLMYNRFLSNFDEELNAAFAQFVADGATELVLDLRYNPGGNVNTSRLLASMIYGTNTSDVYIRQRWNDKIQAQLSDDFLTDYFASSTGSSPINALNLSRVFVLAQFSSASASELVMNGLDPYVDVIHIGETTRGKNEFSITLVDNPGNSFIYNSNLEGDINPDNSWGLQPLVGRNENANGFYDYTSGLSPDIELAEDLANLGVLGNVDEPLLARALQEITGGGAKKDFTVQMKAESFTTSRIQTPIKDNMWLDKPLPTNLSIQ